MSSVKVAVRVRPFNGREKEMSGNQLCIQMSGNQTTIFNHDATGSDKKEYKFSFDYSYWSHDNFRERDDGYFEPLTSSYADQNRVYQDMGVEVLDNAWEGYNACLFAYGQTGSGKSYSMVGYGGNPGIVPRVCEEVFNRIDKSDKPNVRYEVTVAMLEIYNEQVQDLLKPIAERPKGGLRIRQDPRGGTYVENLSRHLVDSYDAIEKKVEKGTANRTVGATQMNATSSRAHTIVSICFKQITLDGDGNPLTQKSSDINLVDLAGSERAGSTGAQGDRLKEGSAINQSLSSLGNVISALADQANGKLGNRVIPYRDSALTRILQNALGGNSKTAMIAALSPSSVNYEETLSTLRYANRVKEIKNQAIVNEDPMEKMIRELKEENERLRKMAGGGGGAGGVVSEDTEALRKYYENLLAQHEKGYTQRLQEEKDADKEEEKEKDSPFPMLLNLNEDTLLSGKLKFQLKEGIMTVGKAEAQAKGRRDDKGESNAVKKPDITLGGLGILKEHAIISTKKVEESDDDSDSSDSDEDSDEEEDVAFECKLKALARTFVNGEPLEEGMERELFHKDVILFGNHNLFVFWEPQNVDKQMPDWEQAMKALNKNTISALSGGSGSGGSMDTEVAEILEKKKKEQEAALEQEREKMRKMQEEYEARMKEQERAMMTKKGQDQVKIREEMRRERDKVERELAEKQRQLEERMKRMAVEEEEDKARLEAERRAKKVLEEIMTRTLLLVEEANCMADELNRNMYFSIKLTTKNDSNAIDMKDLQSLQKTAMQRTEIGIRVEMLDQDVTHFWTLAYFEEKVFEMRDLYADWANADDPDTWEGPQEGSAEDPFSSDPNSLIFIGQANLYLDPIRSLLDVEREATPIFDYKGERMGDLVVGLTMELEKLDENEDDELDDYNNVTELANRNVKLTLKVDQCSDIPDNLSRNVEVILTWIDGVSQVRCASSQELSTNPKFNYMKTFTVPITEETIRWFENVLVFEVYGMAADRAQQEKSAKSSQPRKSVMRSKTTDAVLESQMAEKDEKLRKLEEALRKKGLSLADMLEDEGMN